MVKIAWFPTRIGTVTGGTIFREACQYVVWIFRTLEIHGVTGGTFLGRIFRTGIGVALSTIIRYRRVSTGQRIKLIVVEGAWTPTGCRGMAAYTICR